MPTDTTAANTGETTEETTKPGIGEDAPIELMDDPTKPKPEPADQGDGKDKKTESREAYAARKLKEENDQLRKEVEKSRRKDEETRQAQLTEEQRREEEGAKVREERDRLARENLVMKIGIDAKLPPSMWTRIQGADEEAMRLDAAELAALVKRPAVGSATDPVRQVATAKPTYKRSQLTDRKFYLANEKDILLAQSEGRIVEG